jgi:hypothetical protein
LILDRTRAVAGALRPGERRLKPVVSPKELAVSAAKARGAENIEFLRFCGLRAQPIFDRGGLRRLERRDGID